MAQNKNKKYEALKPDTLTPITTDFVIIEDIQIIGNRRTKEHIILRELDIHEGTVLYESRLDSILERNRNNVFNTDLFITVELWVEPLSEGNSAVNLYLGLRERWYIFPVPLFELSDRNFNEWWNERGRDLSRVNYGIRFIQRNVRGRNETLELVGQSGFRNRFSLDYKIPYINRKQKLGMRIGGSYTQNQSIPFQTINHKLDFFESSNIIIEEYEYRFAINWRKFLYASHDFELKLFQNLIKDSVAVVNPDFFLDGETTQRYFSLTYSYRKDLRDIVAYPLQGYFFRIVAEKEGLGVFNDLNIFKLTTTYALFKKLSQNWFFETAAVGRLSLFDRQPYFNAQGLGYDDEFLRGFELYVIDGQEYLLNKNTLRWRLFDKITYARFIPIEQFRTIPTAVYFTVYGDLGFVRDRFFIDKSNRFANRLIYGVGVGLDLFTYYNTVIKFNYSLNSAGETGFFLNFKGDF